MSVFPVNRVPDILKRMDLNSSQPEAMKTCFGILAIMSREDSNKALIAKDGMEIILNAMTVHVDRTDVQESGCDLLWSLAFNSSTVKDVIAKCGGAVVLVRALKRHSRSADFLKSACGALSNMCQSKLNQEGVSAQGGLQPLVGSIHVHQTNAKLLPFIFDAIASIIVNNEENAKTVSSLGIVPVVVAALSRHKACMEVVKSGCHTLAILSDVKGQASKVTFAGGVPIILSLLDAHPLYADLHRVAAVVLLRMLQESSHVGREITCHEGVRILLNSLEKGGAQQDTVAAVTHILYTVTNPNSPAASAVEIQLWSSAGRGVETAGEARKAGEQLNTTALGGVVMILGQYSARRDVVRAACRLINNISGYNNVVNALDRLGILDRVFECVAIHKDTKDVIDSAASLIKIIHRKHIPVLNGNTGGAVHGLLHVFRTKMNDEDAAVACMDTISNLVETAGRVSAEKSRELKELRMLDDKQWEYHAMTICISLIEVILEAERDGSNSGSTPVSTSGKSGSLNSVTRINWNKGTPRVTNGFVALIEAINHSRVLINDAVMYRDAFEILQSFMRIIPPKHIDIAKRIEKLIHVMDAARKQGDKSVSSGRKSLALKPPLPSQNSVGGLSSVLHPSGTPVASGGASDSEHNRSCAMSGDESESSSIANKSKPEEASLNVSENTIRNEVGNSINADEKDADRNQSRKLLKDRSKSWISAEDVEKGNSLSSTDLVAQKGEKVLMKSAVQPSADDPRKLLPMHPVKVKLNPQGQPDEMARLLETWPNYLERLAPPPVNRAFLSGGGGLSSYEGNSSNPSIPMHMQLVYESNSAAGKALLSKCPTPVPYLVPPQGLGPPFKHSLTFDSDFESGNLLRAVQKKDYEYDLFLRSDLHTPGHTQWFYFAIANAHTPDQVALHDEGVKVPPVRVRFHIVNFTKPDSLFNLGMRPVIYSVLDAANKNIGWVRSGSDISYYSNTFARNNTAGEGLSCYYTLSFSMDFYNPRDTVLIAYSYPFTVSDCRTHISQLLSKPRISDVLRHHKLCQTLSGEDCDLLVISNFRDKDKERIGPINVQSVEFNPRDEYGVSKLGRNKDNSENSGQSSGGTGSNGFYGSSGRKIQQQVAAAGLKPCIFVSGRVHPGETPASWVMKGMLDFLVGDSAQAKALRQTYVIFVVPMLNPDGVMYGNNRCGLAGVDLNRQWKLPVKGLHPTVYFLKNFMIAQRKLRDIPLYIDLHGHSRKYNVFMYGCDDKKRPKPQVRVFPKFCSMHSIGRKYICYADCSFNVKKGRESTARVVVCKELNIPCSFTLEATFCGSNYGPLKHCHMNIGHLQETGASLGDTILSFAIAEQHVKDTTGIGSNVRAVTQMQKIISTEGLNGMSSCSGPVGYLMIDNAGNTFSAKSESSFHRSNSEKVMEVLKNDADCGYGEDEQETLPEEGLAKPVNGRNSISAVRNDTIAHNRHIIGTIRAQQSDGNSAVAVFNTSKSDSRENSTRRRGNSVDEDIEYGPDVIEDEDDDADADTRSSPPRIISNEAVAISVSEGGEKEDVESGSDVSDEDVSDSESLATSDAVLKGNQGSRGRVTQEVELLDPLDQAVRASSVGTAAMTGSSGLHGDLVLHNLSGSNSARAATDRPAAPSGGSERVRGKSLSIMNTGRNVINGGGGGIAVRDDSVDPGYGAQRKTHTVPDNFLSVSSSGKTKSFSKGSNYIGTSIDTSHSYKYKMDQNDSGLAVNNFSNANARGMVSGSGTNTAHEGLKNSLSIVSSGSLASMSNAGSDIISGPLSDRAANTSKWQYTAGPPNRGDTGAPAAGTGIGIYFGNSGAELVSDRHGRDNRVANAIAAADDAIAASIEEGSGENSRLKLPRSSSVEQLSELSVHGADSPGTEVLFNKTAKKSGNKKKKVTSGGKSGAESTGKPKGRKKSTMKVSEGKSAQPSAAGGKDIDTANSSLVNNSRPEEILSYDKENDSGEDFEIVDSPRAAARAAITLNGEENRIGGALGTIVKSEYNEMVTEAHQHGNQAAIRKERSEDNLAKTQAAATPYALPKGNVAQK